MKFFFKVTNLDQTAPWYWSQTYLFPNQNCIYCEDFTKKINALNTLRYWNKAWSHRYKFDILHSSCARRILSNKHHDLCSGSSLMLNGKYA